MNKSKKKEARFPCHIYGMADAQEAYEGFGGELVKRYGDDVRLEDGTVLHDNYEWDDGARILIRCGKCGGLLLQQTSQYHSFSDAPDGHYVDRIPVASVKEADLLNILLGPGEMENVPCRHIRVNNRKVFWTRGGEPEPRDPEELIRQIREVYQGVNAELLEKLIQKAGE